MDLQDFEDAQTKEQVRQHLPDMQVLVAMRRHRTCSHRLHSMMNDRLEYALLLHRSMFPDLSACQNKYLIDDLQAASPLAQCSLLSKVAVDGQGVHQSSLLQLLAVLLDDGQPSQWRRSGVQLLTCKLREISFSSGCGKDLNNWLTVMTRSNAMSFAALLQMATINRHKVVDNRSKLCGDTNTNVCAQKRHCAADCDSSMETDTISPICTCAARQLVSLLSGSSKHHLLSVGFVCAGIREIGRHAGAAFKLALLMARFEMPEVATPWQQRSRDLFFHLRHDLAMVAACICDLPCGSAAKAHAKKRTRFESALAKEFQIHKSSFASSHCRGIALCARSSMLRPLILTTLTQLELAHGSCMQMSEKARLLRRLSAASGILEGAWLRDGVQGVTLSSLMFAAIHSSLLMTQSGDATGAAHTFSKATSRERCAHMTEHFHFGQHQVRPSSDHAEGVCLSHGNSWRFIAQFQLISHSLSLVEMQALCNMQGRSPKMAASCLVHVANSAPIVSWHIIRAILQCQRRTVGIPSRGPKGNLFVDGAPRSSPYAAHQAVAHVISILHDVTSAFVDTSTYLKDHIASDAIICTTRSDALSTSFEKQDALGDCGMVKLCVALSDEKNYCHLLSQHELTPQVVTRMLRGPVLRDALATWLLDIEPPSSVGPSLDRLPVLAACARALLAAGDDGAAALRRLSQYYALVVSHRGQQGGRCGICRACCGCDVYFVTCSPALIFYRGYDDFGDA